MWGTANFNLLRQTATLPPLLNDHRNAITKVASLACDGLRYIYYTKVESLFAEMQSRPEHSMAQPADDRQV